MEEKQEKMILAQEPVPGYRKVFHIAFAVGVTYLVIVFARILF
jgi:hypothetical protein